MRRIINRGLYLFLLFVVFFLFFRIILKLLGANPLTFFTIIIYFVSDILILPFRNIFPQVFPIDRSMVDTVAIFSLFAYIILILSIIVSINIIHTILVWLHIIREHPQEAESSEERMIKETGQL